MKISRERIGCVFAILACGTLVFEMPVFINLARVIIGAGFFISEEPSLFTFRVTRENDGSGEYWLYAEDPRYFYDHASLEEGALYLAFPQEKIDDCPGFFPQDFTTWCPEFKIRGYCGFDRGFFNL